MSRVAIIEGFRTPMGKVLGSLKNLQADELAVRVCAELIARYYDIQFDELICGNVAQPAGAMNIARVIALNAGLPKSTSAFTVHRNCASGMEAIYQAFLKIKAGAGSSYLICGTESMSNIPLLFGKKMTSLFAKLQASKSIASKLAVLSTFRPSFLQPVIGLMLGLTDPTCNLIMGKTAENIAKDFAISRSDQDKFALRSHNLSEQATKNGSFASQILAIENGNGVLCSTDEGIRNGQTIEALAKLKPYFEKPNGTVTVGNSSQITDGACAMILMSEEKARTLGLTPLAYIKDCEFTGCEQTRMGLGPVYSTARLLKRTKNAITDFDLIELNEAFASQAIGCLLAFDSADFFSKNLPDFQKLGSVDLEKVNTCGGAISLGHPVGMTGARIVLHLAKQLKEKQKSIGLATLCIGGGQGGSLIVEAN